MPITVAAHATIMGQIVGHTFIRASANGTNIMREEPQRICLSELILRGLEGVAGRAGKSQKEGQEDQGEVEELVGTSWLFQGPLVLLAPPFWPFLELPGTPSSHLQMSSASGPFLFLA